MYGSYAMQPPMGPFMPWWPPINQPTNNQNPAEVITGWIKSLEDLKRSFKEEKKEDKKKQDTPGILATSLFFLLISPVTGPIMFKFFELSAAYIHR